MKNFKEWLQEEETILSESQLGNVLQATVDAVKRFGIQPSVDAYNDITGRTLRSGLGNLGGSAVDTIKLIWRKLTNQEAPPNAVGDILKKIGIGIGQTTVGAATAPISTGLRTAYAFVPGKDD